MVFIDRAEEMQCVLLEKITYIFVIYRSILMKFFMSILQYVRNPETNKLNQQVPTQGQEKIPKCYYEKF